MTTQLLTNEKYDGIPFSLQGAILKHVNKEEKKWYRNERTTPPKFRKSKVAPLSAGVFNMVRQFVP